jgi:hypothetical protein
LERFWHAVAANNEAKRRVAMSDLMSRRGVVGALVALPAGLFLVHCSSNNDTAAAGAAPQHVGTQTIYTSSSTGGHTHTFTIADSAITSPPPAGLSGPTSTDAGHSHDVAMPMATLQQMAAGQSVDIATTGGSHTHTFTFTKVF